MKIETLKDRIKKAEEKLIKINGTLARHKKQLEKKSKVLIDKGIDLNNYDKYDRSIITDETYWDICDYEHKLEDIDNNNKKIKETINIIEKLKKQLSDQLAKENEVENSIPKALNVFLENWKQKCFDYYIELTNEYIEIISKKEEDYKITKEELKALKEKKYSRKSYNYEYVDKYTNEEIENILNNDIPKYKIGNIKYYIKDRYINEFRNRHFASDMVIVDKIISDDIINNDKLNKILDDEVKAKKEMFIYRIKQVIGEIKDLSQLRIAGTGEINGIAKGVKCNAKVETITAGGYNIQCYHFRVLVNIIK